MAQIDIDGKRVNIPDYMLDATGEKLVKHLERQTKENRASSVETNRHLKKMVQIWADNPDQFKAHLKSTSRDIAAAIEDQTDTATDENKKNTEYTVKSFSNNIRRVHNAILKADKWVFGAIGVATTAFTIAAGQLVGQFLQVGNTARQLAEAGAGMDEYSGQLFDTMSQFNRLGISGSEAAGIMANFADVVAVQGRQAFVDASVSLAGLTGEGTKLGMTMAQATEVIAADLQLRKNLGLLAATDQKLQAKRSTELYKKQYMYAQATGMSINELRNASADFVENTEFMMMVNRVAGQGNIQVANDMVAAMQDTASRLKSMGLDDEVMNMIGESVMGVDALLTDGGRKLYTSLSVIGTDSARGVMSSIDELNAAKQSMDPARIKAATDKLQNSFAALGTDMSRMSPVQQQQLQMMMKQIPGLEAIMRSSMSAAQAQKNLAKVSSDAAVAYDAALTGGLMGPEQAAAQTEQMMNKLGSAFESIRNQIVARLSPAFTGLITAFGDGSKPNSPMAKFSLMIEKIGKSLMMAFGATGDNLVELGESFAEKLGLWFDSIGSWFENGGAQSIVDGFTVIGMVIGNFVEIFSNIMSAFGVSTEAPEGETDEERKARLSGMADTITDVIIGFTALSAGVKVLTGLMTAAAFLDFFKKGGAAGAATDAATNATPGFMGKAWDKVKGLGKNAVTKLGKGNLATVALGTAAEYGGDYLKEQGHEKSGSALSIAGNAAQWAGTGAMIGSFIPGMGTAFGAAVGAGLGGLMGLAENWDTLFKEQADATAAIAPAVTAAQSATPAAVAAANKEGNYLRQVRENQLSSEYAQANEKELYAAFDAQDAGDETLMIKYQAKRKKYMREMMNKYDKAQGYAVNERKVDTNWSMFNRESKATDIPTYNERMYSKNFDNAIEDKTLEQMSPVDRMTLEILGRIDENTAAGAKESKKTTRAVSSISADY